MSSSNYLPELINSLDRGEKLNFKKFTGQSNKSTQTVKLFNLIEQHPDWGDQKLQAKTGNAISALQLSVLKNQVFHLITDSLVFYSDKHYHLLRKKLNKVECLIEKGLAEAAFKENLRVLEKAKASEHTSSEMEALKIMIRIARFLPANTHPVLQLNNLYKQLKQVHQKSKIETQYALLSAKAYQLLSQNNLKPEVKSFQALTQSKWVTDGTIPCSFFSELNYWGLKMALYTASFDYRQCYTCSKKITDLYEKNSYQLKDYAIAYYYSLYNRHSFEIITNQPLLAANTLEQAWSFATGNNILNKSIKLNLAMTMAGVYNKNGDFDKTIAQFSSSYQTVSFEQLLQTDLAMGIVYWYQVGYAYFGKEDYKTSLRILTQLINTPGLQIREDVVLYARILQLIIYWETNADEQLFYTIRSVYRLLLKKSLLSGVEKFLVLLIKNHLKHWGNREQMKKDLEQTHTELLKIKSEDTSLSSLEYFDIIRWIESKVTGKSFSETIQLSIKK